MLEIDTGVPVEVSSSTNLYLILIIAAIVVVSVAVGIFLGRRSKSTSLEDKPPRQELPPAQPPRTVERAVLDRPVEDVEGLSLRELREARGAKLSEAYKSSDDAQMQREFRKGAQDRAAEEAADTPVEELRRVAEAAAEAPPIDAPATLDTGLEKTRSSGFIGRLSKIFGSGEKLDDSMIEAIEEVLFTADIGASTSHYLLEKIQESIASGTATVEDVWSMLRQECEAILDAVKGELVIDDRRPFVVLVVGVNGVGKTTTIGKLAARYKQQGKKVMMIAGDTFRAAAVQQLEEWANRVGCGFYRGADEADPSGVIFDGIKKAEDEGYDIVLADTAGRLHTRAPLVDELKKIVRVADKALPDAPHETVLVLDANTGQNAIQQARLFNEAVPLSGLVLTKLDGTAKGGIVLGISRELKLPVYFIGIGEGIRDLRPFRAAEFVDALF